MNSVGRLVIFFHPRFSDGGVERTNIYLAKGLIAKGYDVEFLTTEMTQHFRAEVEQAGVKVVELGGGRTLGSLWGLRRRLSDAAASWETVYFVSCQYYVNVVSMLLALITRRRFRNVRFVNSERNHFDEFNTNRSAKGRVVLWLVRMLYRFADVVVANARETAEDLEQLVGRKVHWVYNPTVNDRLAELREEPVTEKWFTEDTRPCVMGVGRLSAQKDFSTLLRAFRLVRNSVSARLVLLGEGELRSKLEEEVLDLGLAGDVYLPGFVANPYKFLVRSDVFVLSSRYEGLPNALIEAVFLGVPCVSTACKSGPREILLEGGGGRLVAVGAAEAMAEAIISTLQDRETAQAMCKVALGGVERFSYKAVSARFASVINE